MFACAGRAYPGDFLGQGFAFQIPEEFSEGHFPFADTDIVRVALATVGINCGMDASPCYWDAIAAFFPDGISQTGRSVKKPAHETYTNRIDFPFLYEVGHSVKIGGIVGSVKENLGSKALVLQRRVNILEPKIVGAVYKRNEQGRTLRGHDKFLSTRSDNCFSIAYQLSNLGGDYHDGAPRQEFFVPAVTVCLRGLCTGTIFRPLTNTSLFPRIHNQCARATCVHQPADYGQYGRGVVSPKIWNKTLRVRGSSRARELARQ
jgi:hypothetical protein